MEGYMAIAEAYVKNMAENLEMARVLTDQLAKSCAYNEHCLPLYKKTQKLQNALFTEWARARKDLEIDSIKI